MERPSTVDMSTATLLRDALMYVTGVQEALADCRLDHAELDANRAAACLRFLQGREGSLAWVPVDQLLAELARRQARAE